MFKLKKNDSSKLNNSKNKQEDKNKLLFVKNDGSTNLMYCLKTLDFINNMENFYDCENKPCNDQVEDNLKEMQKIKCKMKKKIIRLLRGKSVNV